jgi:integrase
MTPGASTPGPASEASKGVGELGLPPLEPRTLTDDQLRSLKYLCDRLHRFHQLKGDPGQTDIRLHANARPWRDRAIVFFLLSTGLRREELVRLDLDQVIPNTPEALRVARKAQVLRVKGKGKSMRHVFLSPRSINTLLEQIGKWHDAEQKDQARMISPLRPHDLRHTFGVQLSKVTKVDRYELQRRLGHRSERYIARYTNPPENVAAQYIEDF